MRAGPATNAAHHPRKRLGFSVTIVLPQAYHGDQEFPGICHALSLVSKKAVDVFDVTVHQESRHSIGEILRTGSGLGRRRRCGASVTAPDSYAARVAEDLVAISAKLSCSARSRTSNASARPRRSSSSAIHCWLSRNCSALWVSESPRGLLEPLPARL